MRPKFSLFQSHLDLAHLYWKQLIQKGDFVIDATCGNGQDTLFLAQLCLKPEIGTLYAIDILPKAIHLSQKNLEQNLDASLLKHVKWVTGCHSQFPLEIDPETVKLIVYNLGYLPGGNKNLTTHVHTTLKSLNAALTLIQPGGIISLTLYPGHPEGEREEEQIIKFSQELDPLFWSSCHHQWLNRKKSPSLLILQKKFDLNTQSN